MKSKMKIAVRLVLLLAIAGGVAWWWFVYRPRHQDSKQLVLSGSIEANTVEVGSLLGGRVATVHVKEGDVVHAGEPLVTFEPDLRDLEIAQQRALVTQGRAELAKVKRGPRFWRDTGLVALSSATAARTRARRADLSACSCNSFSASL